MLTGLKNRLKLFLKPELSVRYVDKEIEPIENIKKEYLLSKYGFCQLPTIDILDLLPSFTETVNNYTFLEGTSLISDIAFLKAMARKYENCNYLEIGSWRGESLSNVAEVAKKCTSLTLSPKEMREMNISEEFINVHGIFSKGLPNVEKIEHNSHTFDFGSLNQKFDMIFVDGDHSHEGVKNDSEKVLPILKNDSSIIIWHDYGNYTERVNYVTLAGILDGIPKNEHKYLFHVSNTMCAIMIRKEFKSYYSKFPTHPNKKFNIKFETQKI